MKRIKAKFIGKPDRYFPSLKTNKVYDLEIVSFCFIVKWITKIQVEIRKPIHCPYSSWKAFYKNWKLLEVY